MTVDARHAPVQTSCTDVVAPLCAAGLRRLLESGSTDRVLVTPAREPVSRRSGYPCLRCVRTGGSHCVEGNGRGSRRDGLIGSFGLDMYAPRGPGTMQSDRAAQAGKRQPHPLIGSQ